MEAFAPLPFDLFADANAILEDDPNSYFSLSQFDLELQQQAQAALLEQQQQQQQQQESWQDFDKYLPVDDNSQLFNDSLRNEQAQPIFMNNNTQAQPIFNFNNPSTILYEPLSDLIPTQQQFSEEQQIDNKEIVKQEYASPESLPYSPPQQQQQQQDDSSTKQSTTTTTSPIDFTNWNSPLSSMDGKVPIQRLKSNTIIANAVNATLNNKSTSSIATATTTIPSTGRQHKKTAHNAIERRYRNNINDRIAELKNAVPALLYAKVKDNNRTGKRSRGDDEDDEGEDGEEYLDGVAVATKLNKATILRKATEYINHLKKTGDDVRRENETLQHILAQLPGGSDILQRYHLQKQQREKELHQQQLKEREALKLQEQQRKAANRKRAKHNNTVQQRQHHDHSDEYESSSSSPGSMDHPVTPPTMTNRVFMAVFMAITLFSTSPLTTGPSSSEQFENHHHATKASSTPSSDLPTTTTILTPNTPPESFLGSFFKFDDGWLTLRTIIFMICIAQLFLPWIRYLFFGSSLKLKRVNKAKRAITISPRKEISNSVATPGELKNRHICNLLEKSIRFEDEDSLPDNTLTLIFPLIKETVRIFSHHFLGYDIMYGDSNRRTAEEEWARVCKWIKLNETRCVGGDPTLSRLSMLYSCFRMINLVDTLEEGGHDHARAYATAAMQISLIIPYRSLADRLSDYFWLHAVSQYRYQLEDDEDFEECWLQSLSWADPDQDYNMLDMRDTQAWIETMDILRNQTNFSTSHTPLGLSYTAPVSVPIAILSTLHLLDSLENQYDRLVSTIASDSKRHEPTAFLDIMMLTSNDEQQRLAHWLATVGAIVEALWKNEPAHSYIPALIQRVPRSMTCKTGSQKSTVHQLDEMTKKSLIHTLIGAVLLKGTDVEKQKQGLAELENAQSLRSTIRKASKNRQTALGLESTVMAMAEFVVSYVGLESWINAMRLEVSAEKEVMIDEEVREVTLHLRRMIRDLQGVSDHQSIVERLSRLGRYIAHHPGDTDSACDLSDREDEDEDFENDDDHQLIKKADKAQLILRGLA